MDAGQLDQRVKLKRKVTVREQDTGNETITYAVVATIAAKHGSIRGREYLSMQQQFAELLVPFTVYYREDIEPDWRIEWKGKDYELIGPPVPIGHRQWLELDCRTAQV